MDSNNKNSLEKFNYKDIYGGQPSCILCNHSENNINISDNGVITSKCYFFDMDVDERHICDLIKVPRAFDVYKK